MCPLRLTGELEAFRGKLVCPDAETNERLLCAGGCAPRVRPGQPRCSVLQCLLLAARDRRSAGAAEALGLLLTESRLKGEIKIRRDKNPRNNRSCLYWF